jgi:uncharacterized protein YkwD
MNKKICFTLLLTWAFAQTPLYAQRTHETHSEKVSPGNTAVSDPKTTPNLDQVKEQIFKSTNKFRTEEKRGELKMNDKLSSAAQSFADYLARTDEFSHTANSKEPWQRTSETGYKHCIIAENIAYEYDSDGFSTEALASALIEGWKKSPGHRKNMLDPDVQEIGVGVAHSNKTGRYYAVQDFGRPHSAAITFKIQNQTDVPIKYAMDGQSLSVQPGYTITYERCRPPEVRFQWAADATVTPDAKEAYHPTSGVKYTLRKTDQGFSVASK